MCCPHIKVKPRFAAPPEPAPFAPLHPLRGWGKLSQSQS
jgi:hypothetical protein